MIAEITLYRCYWPQVFHYLKNFEISNFKSEAFGMLMTLDIAPELARRIAAMLPIGAVVDLVELSSTDPMEMHEIDDLLLGTSSSQSLKSDKN